MSIQEEFSHSYPQRQWIADMRRLLHGELPTETPPGAGLRILPSVSIQAHYRTALSRAANWLMDHAGDADLEEFAIVEGNHCLVKDEILKALYDVFGLLSFEVPEWTIPNAIIVSAARKWASTEPKKG